MRGLSTTRLDWRRTSSELAEWKKSRELGGAASASLHQEPVTDVTCVASVPSIRTESAHTPWLRVLGAVVDLNDDSLLQSPAATATGSGEVRQRATEPMTSTFAYDSDAHDSESVGLLVLHAFVGSTHVLALVDSGASDNIVSEQFVKKQRLKYSDDGSSMLIRFADGSCKTIRRRLVRRTPFHVDNASESLSAIVAPIANYDVILGLPWIRKHSVKLDVGARTVTAEYDSGSHVFTASARRDDVTCPIMTISANAAECEIRNGATGFLCFVSEAGVITSAMQIGDEGTTEAERIQLKALIERHRLLFPDKLPDELPPHRDTVHGIDLVPGAEPPYRPPIRIPLNQLPELERQIRELIRTGRLRPSLSPFGAPVFFVQKKDGSMRMVCDWRSLNAITVKNRTVVPNMREMIDQLRGARYFSKLDLFAGYNQIAIRPGDEPKTAITTPFGHFEWTVMGFGLTNAPATFQAFMTDLVRPGLYKFVIAYLDDVLIYSRTMDEHIAHLSDVLSWLEEGKVYCKPSKCVIGVKSVGFLGCVVGDGQVAIDPEKVQIVKDWPLPRDKSELRSFVGMITWFCEHLHSAAEVLAPLTDMQSTDVKFDAQVVEKAVAAAKKLVVDAPALQLPDPQRPFYLFVDGSLRSIGGVIMQEATSADEDLVKPGRWVSVDDEKRFLVAVAFFSKKLSKEELDYHTYNKESLALFQALQKYRPWVWGAEIFVFSDQNPLKYLLNQRGLTNMQSNWLQFLGEFDLRIHHIAGKLNAAADALSRAPHSTEATELPARLQEEEGAVLLTQPCDEACTRCGNSRTEADVVQTIKLSLKEEIASATRTDSHLAKIVEEAGVSGSTTWMGQHYEVKDGVLYSRADGLTRVVVPSNQQLRTRLIAEAHDTALAAHQGRDKTIDRLRTSYTWVGLGEDVAKFVASCVNCQLSKHSNQGTAGLLMPLPVDLQRPWIHVNMDFITGFKRSPTGNDAVLTVVDRGSKMVHLVPVKKTFTAADTGKTYLKEIVRLHGFPVSITTDRGPQFISAFWNQLMKSSGTELRFSTANHPQTDGQAEVFNKKLLTALRAMISVDDDDFESRLPAIEFALNSSVSATTKMSPFMTNYGFNPDTPLTMWMKADSAGKVEEATTFVTRMKGIWAEAQDNVRLAQLSMAHQANKSRTDLRFAVGDKVMVAATHLMSPAERAKEAPKLRQPYSGPYTVVEVINNNAYRLDLPEQMKAHDVVNVSALQPFVENVLTGRKVISPPAIVIGQDGDEEQVVEKILKSRTHRGRRQYLTRWLGKPSCEDSWEFADIFVDNDGTTTEAFADYMKLHPAEV